MTLNLGISGSKLSHNVSTIWKKSMKQLCIYTEIDHFIEWERCCVDYMFLELTFLSLLDLACAR